MKIGVPTRWSSFVARAHYLSWVLLIAARMSRTKEPDALGSMVSCALILASILTQGHELWPRSLKLPSLPSQPVTASSPNQVREDLPRFKSRLPPTQCNGATEPNPLRQNRGDTTPRIVRSHPTSASTSRGPVVGLRAQIGV